MASLRSVTYSSNSIVGKDGRYLLLTVTQISKDSINNKSLITWELSTNGGSNTFYDTFCMISINGRQVYFSNGTAQLGGYNGWIVENSSGLWLDANGSEQTCAKWGFLASNPSSTPIEILHDGDGTKNLNIRFLVGCSYPIVKDCGGVFTLDPIDREEPKITQNSPSSISYSSCTISASSNVNCSRWWYRKKDYTSGEWPSSWIQVDTSNPSGTNKSVSVTGLTPGNEYNFQWKAEKTSNNITGESNVSYVKTLGASILNSISDNVYLDVANPTITYNITTYSTGFYNRLTFTKDGNILNINLGKSITSGTKTLTLTSAQVTTLLSWISSTADEYSAENINAAIYTYANSGYTTQIGTQSVLTGAFSVSIHKENALPTLTVGGYTVSNATNNDNQLVVIGSSSIVINNIVATTKYNATISSLVIKSPNNNVTKTINTGSVNSYSGNYTWGTIAAEYASLLEVVLTDTRGNVVSVPLPLKVYRVGDIIKPEVYNNWRSILKPHFDAKDYNGNYYLTGSSYGFTLPTVSSSKKISGSDVSGDSNSIKSHLNTIKNCSYIISDGTLAYSPVSTSTTNATNAASGATYGKEILKSTKDTIDNNLNTIDQIVLFNLIKG